MSFLPCAKAIEVSGNKLQPWTWVAQQPYAAIGQKNKCTRPTVPQDSSDTALHVRLPVADAGRWAAPK
jgi:hypothetical protein